MKPLAIAILLSLGLSSCTPGARFMDFGWKSAKAEIADTLRASGFTFNAQKERWQDGSLYGFTCEKVKVWYDEAGFLNAAEARYEGVDSITSQRIYTFLLSKTTGDFGTPDMITDQWGDIPMNRRIWRLGKIADDRNEIIVLTRFNDVVIYNASRIAPEPFELSHK